MDAPKHTPGPWRFEWGYVGASRRPFAVPPAGDGLLMSSETEARNLVAAMNAHSELLALCKEAEHLMPYIPAESFDGHAAGFFRRLAEAIKKAEGGAT